METPNLIAYIPVLNQRHLNWFQEHRISELYLISQEMAESFLPRLKRNMAAIPTEVMVNLIYAGRFVRNISIFDPFFHSSISDDWVLPDEDVSRAVAEEYLKSAANLKFEMIWSRWDMTAVKKKQPVIVDVEVSRSELDVLRMQKAQVEALKSPDWWRQIGAAAFMGEECLAMACNTHLPNEYEVYMFGDPRMNYGAGQPGVYTALHAERAVIALCAREGKSLLGASMYVTTFPCEDCAREIAFTGVKKLFFSEGYSALNAQEVLRSCGVEIVQVVQDPSIA